MIFFAVLAFVATEYSIFPALPREQVAQEFAAAKAGYEERWDAFREQRTFTPFASGRQEKDLDGEFLKIRETRYGIWYRNPDELLKESAPRYEVSKPLLFQDGARAKNCIAFAYNNTVPYFNASTVYVGDVAYIACEGPRSKDIPKFFQMMAAYRVTHLVRLTDSYEGNVKKCHPYWEGLLKEGDSGASLLNIPLDGPVSYPVRTFIMDDWRDHHGIGPKRLLDVVLQVRKEVAQRKGLCVVHCSAGVGRTGTFLAAVAIVDAIDRGKPLSIEEIVYQLALQRIHAVSRITQYETLHRLAEEYLRVKSL
jgi:hypothetical protein